MHAPNDGPVEIPVSQPGRSRPVHTEISAILALNFDPDQPDAHFVQSSLSIPPWACASDAEESVLAAQRYGNDPYAPRAAVTPSARISREGMRLSPARPSLATRCGRRDSRSQQLLLTRALPAVNTGHPGARWLLTQRRGNCHRRTPCHPGTGLTPPQGTPETPGLPLESTTPALRRP